MPQVYKTLKLKKQLLLLLVLVCVDGLLGQNSKAEKEETLDEIVITATRTQRQLSALPLPAQVVSKEEILAVNSVRLNNILNEQTGLITVPDFGGGEGIQLQGLDSQYTLILLDGVPLVGRSAGTLDLNRISVGNIKQIEIIKGASSSLYGNEALGGVINIITETSKLGFNGKLNYRGGGFNQHDSSISAGYKNKSLELYSFINRYSSDGNDLTDVTSEQTVEPFYNFTVNQKIAYKISDRTKLLISGRIYHQNQDNSATNNLRGKSKINEWNTLLKMDHDFGSKWKAYFEFYATQYGANEYLNEPNGILFSRSEFTQSFIRPELRTTYNFDNNSSIIAGIGVTNERLKRSNFITDPEFNSPYIYVQYDGKISNNLNVIVGGRFDSHDAYKSQFSPKGALRLKLNDVVSFKGSVGYGFKAPDFRQLYFDFTNSTVGYTVLGYNAVTTKIPELEANGELAGILVPLSDFYNELKPESSVSYNFGVEYKPSNAFKLFVNIFRNNIKNLIDTQVIARKTNGQNVFSYYNINDVYTQGLELNTTYKINANLKINGGYQLLYARDKVAEKAFQNGEVFARSSPSAAAFELKEKDYFGLLNRSRHMANFKIFFQIPEYALNANIRGTYRSKYGLFDTNGNTYLDVYDDFIEGYTIWDFAINKRIFKDYELGFGIDNLFNFTNPQHITNIAGRIIYATLKINF